MAGDGKAVVGRSLFVRNLPYTTTDAELSSSFEKYGPIKSCFTVKEKGVVERCRGFGYVIFETREAAEKAKVGVKKINGRPVQVIFSNKRPLKPGRKKNGECAETEKEEKEREDLHAEGYGEGTDEDEEDSESDYETLSARHAEAKPPKHHKAKSERRDARYNVGRVVVVTGIPPATHKKKLRKKCAKFGPLEEFSYPVETEGEGGEETTAHVMYKDYQDARKAVKGLTGLKLDGTVNPLRAVLMSKEGKTVSKQTLMKSRLIVRNLSFQCHARDIQKIFSQYGEVQEVHIPRKSNGHMLGYGFVQFTSYFDAARALEAINGTEIKGRPVAVDWVVAKHKYEEGLQRAQEREGEADEEEEEEEEEKMDTDEEIESESELSGEEGGRGEGESEEESEGESEGVSEGGSDNESTAEDDTVRRKPVKPDVHEGKTVFVRNLPLDAQEDELEEIFSQFGRVRYARVVMDRVTGLNRGSGFVQFIHPASLQRCLESSEKEEQSLLYNGKQLDVSLALSPRELEQMMERGKKEKADKRNLYLAKEGTILPDSEAAKDLSKSDMAKRMKAHAEKKTKLDNPNFFVSQTRLSVRNLPTQVTEKRLKEIFLNASGGGKVKQLKILRSKDRVDSQGIGRSKGFAFVEFLTHESALAALRATNNNPQIFGPNKRLIVEFAVEDARVVKARLQKQHRSTTAKKNQPAAGRGKTNQEDAVIGGEGEGEGRQMNKEGAGEGARLSRKVQWQLKCKEKRLRRNEKKKAGRSEGGEGRKTSGKGDSSQHKVVRGPVTGAEGTAKRNIGKTSGRSVAKVEGSAQKTGNERGTGFLAGRGSGRGRGGRRSDIESASRQEGGTLLTRSSQRGRKRKLETVSGHLSGARPGENTDYASSSTKRPRRGGKNVVADQLNVTAPKHMGRKQSRKGRRRAVEEREEEDFAKMVDNYRRKFFASASDSR